MPITTASEYKRRAAVKAEAKASFIQYGPSIDGKQERWVSNVKQWLRVAGSAHAFVRLDHTGWYVDEHWEETIHGVVVRLPSKKGKLRLLAALNDAWDDGSLKIDFSHIYDSERDAALAADSMAKYEAEESREFYRKEDIQLQIEELEDQLQIMKQDIESADRILANLRQEYESLESEKEKLENEYAQL